MDWKTKVVLPPNYVSLRHLKELREKEKAEIELKIREEAEAEYRFRLEEEKRLKKLKEDEENRLKEEEKKMKREKEEEERLRREIIRRDQILRTRTLLCGEPSRTRRDDDWRIYSDDDYDGVNQVIGDKQQEEIKKEIVIEVIKDENLEGGKKKNWGKKRRKKENEKKALELESLTLKSIEEEKVIPPVTKPSGFKEKAKGIVDKKIVMNQKVEEEEIVNKIGDLNVDDKKNKMIKKPKAEKLHFPQPQMNRYPHSQIKNFSKHGKRIDSAMNPRNASGSSSLVWVAKTDEN